MSIEAILLAKTAIGLNRKTATVLMKTNPDAAVKFLQSIAKSEAEVAEFSPNYF